MTSSGAACLPFPPAKILTTSGPACLLFPAGKTSALSVKTVLESFKYLRDLLSKVKNAYRAEHGTDEDPFPSPEGIDLAKLAGGYISSDHANAAKATSNAIADAVCGRVAAILEDMKAASSAGGDVAAASSLLPRLVRDEVKATPIPDVRPEAVATALRPQCLGCLLHLNNLIVGAGVKAENTFMEKVLAASSRSEEQVGHPGEEVDAGVQSDTQSYDLNSLLRAAAKLFDFRTLQAYAKGDAIKLFEPWVQRKFEGIVVANSFRAEKGGRQDHAVEAAIELFHNREVFLAYLVARSESQEDGRLRSYLKGMLGSLEVVGALMARSILFDKIFEPLRFLASSNELRDLGFTSYHMAAVYQRLDHVLATAEENPSILMDDSLDVFLEVLQEHNAQDQVDSTQVKDLYVQHRAHLLEERKQAVTAPDATGRAPTKPWAAQVRRELYDPQDPTNLAAVPHAKQTLGVWAEAMREYLRKGPAKEYLLGGVVAETPPIQWRRAHGTDRTNNTSESIFGAIKQALVDFPGTSPATISGICAARRQGVFDSPVPRPERLVCHKPKDAEQGQEPSPFGVFFLDEKMQLAVFACAMRNRESIVRGDNERMLQQKENRQVSIHAEAGVP